MEDEKEAKTFFNATFRSGRSVTGTNAIKTLYCILQIDLAIKQANLF